MPQVPGPAAEQRLIGRVFPRVASSLGDLRALAFALVRVASGVIVLTALVMLNNGRALGLKVGLFPIHEYWTDIGQPEDLEAADALHRERS